MQNQPPSIDVMDIWTRLPIDTRQLLEVQDNCFEYPKGSPFIKGIFQSTSAPDHRAMPFMSFGVSIRASAEEEDIDCQTGVLTFYQPTAGYWMFTLSNDVKRATFANPMMCCEHATEMAMKLSKGESAHMHLTDADGTPMVVEIQPIGSPDTGN